MSYCCPLHTVGNYGNITLINENNLAGKTVASSNGQWHTEYMARVKTLPIESLRYIIEDCRQAMAALPDGDKWGQYADEVHYCHAEIKNRQGAR